MAKLTLNELKKQFTPKVIPVRDISLEVEDGEFLTLLGPSGCGKSTLLRLIAGLESPSSGKIAIGNRDVTNLPPGDRDVAMVFQSYALYPHMTVADNITSALKLRRVAAADIRQRLTAVVQTLDLDGLLERKPAQLSGGQRQRVALARTLVRQPEVFLLDEPLSNLDALLREQVRTELKQLFKTQNRPVVYVTHDQTEAMTLSSQVAVLRRGIVQQLAPPRRLYTHPANYFVAEFVGSPQMNLWTLQCENRSAYLGKVPIPLPDEIANVQQVVFGIRPEDIALTPEGDCKAIAGRIVLVEALGRENLVSLSLHGADCILRALLPADFSLSAEEMRVYLPRRNCHWFDVQTGDRLAFE